jgi:transcriptional regulator with XRE-family HTH domain
MPDQPAMDAIDSLAGNLSLNLLALRRERSWTQRQLAERAGVPRSTVANMESGAGNPSLVNLARVAAALGLGIEELLARPRNACKLIRAAEVVVRSRSRGRVRIHKLLPERVRGLEIDRIDLAPSASMGGTPHVLGTKEYCYCLEGALQVLVSGQAFELGAGDVLAFPGDQRHSYRNPGRTPAIALSVVVPVPAGAGA